MIETTLDGKTKNITEDNVELLKRLFPEIITEDKIDFSKLREILGEEIDDTNEKYDFTWKGKHEAVKISQTPSEGTLRPTKEDSKNWNTTENLYIEGDNLEVLKLLQKSYYGKIKMIYLDPPYNTGNDFVYEDDFKDNLKNYIEQDEKGFNVSSNPETSGRFHTNWLNMMYPRLKLARNLLKEDGVIFISIDDNELNNLKKICDEIFGEKTFLGQITWYKKRKGSFLSKTMVNVTEYILIYGKTGSIPLYGGESDKNESQPLIKRTNSVKKLFFPKNVIKTKLPEGIYEKGVYGKGTSSVKLLNNFEVKNGEIIDDITLEGPFIWNQENLNRNIEIGSSFVINTKNLQPRVFKKSIEKNHKGLSSFINGVEIKGTNEDGYEELKKIFGLEKIMDYPKPVNLINYLIDSAVHYEDNEIILDFFAGSSTTAHAVLLNNSINNKNNKYILAQLPEKISEDDNGYKLGFKKISDMGMERIRRAGDKLLEEYPNANIDVGFKVFKLDTSNLTKWNPDVDNLEHSLIAASDNIVKDRSELDLVYEIMLKYGVELTSPIEELSYDKYNFYSVGMGALVICLNDHVTRDVAENVLRIKEELSPDVIRVVFKDNGFESDADKTNIKEILRNNEVDEFITI